MDVNKIYYVIILFFKAVNEKLYFVNLKILFNDALTLFPLNCSNNNNMNKPHFCVSTFVLLFRSLKSILQMCKHFVHTE